MAGREKYTTLCGIPYLNMVDNDQKSYLKVPRGPDNNCIALGISPQLREGNVRSRCPEMPYQLLGCESEEYPRMHDVARW